jgi:cytidylate kinase
MPAHVDHYVDTLDRAQRHWQTRHGQDARGGTAPALTVALEREAGTFGTTLARELGRRLDWPVYDHELLERIAQETGLRVSLLESVDERPQGWLQEAFRGFTEVPQVSENAYVRHLVETVLSLGKHGHCVIVGRGAAQILPAETTLRVRLIAPRKDRVATAARRLGLSQAEAARWVEDTDRERVRFVRDHFLKDPTDPAQYDLVLGTARWTDEDCAELIAQAMRRLEARAPTLLGAAPGR